MNITFGQCSNISGGTDNKYITIIYAVLVHDMIGLEIDNHINFIKIYMLKRSKKQEDQCVCVAVTF